MRPSDSRLTRQEPAQAIDVTGDEEVIGLPPDAQRRDISKVMMAALLVITVLLLANFLAIRALTVETQRVACYQRLSFISSQMDDAGLPAVGTARLCEGSRPLVEFRDEASEPARP